MHYPSPQPLEKPAKAPPPKWAMTCGYVVVAAIVLGVAFGCIAVFRSANGASSPTPTANTTQTSSQPTTRPTSQVVQYPPKTKADLLGLARQGDANAVYAFHSESVGMTGVCPQPKVLVTVAHSLTGKQLAQDLLAYFYGNHLDNPCGAVVFAFHSQAEGNGENGYTAGRVLLDTDNPNSDPSATNIKYTVTLDTGDVTSGQEYTVSYVQ